MADKPQHKRRNYFIKKGFQLNFSARFLLLVVIEAFVLAGLFWYLSLDTLTTSYQGAQLRIENTSRFFFPSLAYAGLVVIAVVALFGLAGLIFISHRIAGPLYRFEEGLKQAGSGDLAHRIQLRKRDQLADLADTLNNFTSSVDKKVYEMKGTVHEMNRIMAEIQLALASDESVPVSKIEPLFRELSKRLNNLKDEISHFRTSQGDSGKA